jgi:trehalose 6-phosphate synthase/phosphatase
MLYVVSNRLPVTVVQDKVDYKFLPSSGGLVSGLSSYLQSLTEKGGTYTWVGWPGSTIKDRHKDDLKATLLSELYAYPVFLSEKEMDKFYFGFCNRTIWPLFHYLPSYVSYDAENWDSYQYVNEVYFQTLREIVRPDDLVWVQDYHLMLLPKLLRQHFPTLRIGFFLHIPFPSYEIYRLLPRIWGRDILEGLLGADLLGFHTHDYTQYFLRCVLRILGYEHNMGTLIINERVVRADTFPIGIDFDRFHNAAHDHAIQHEVNELRKKFNDAKVILSIDRLDYTKGIINRLRGFELFLENNPDWHGRVVLLAVVVPSRVGVEHYQLMKRQIDELVGKINGRFSRIDWTPIIYQYRSFTFEPLMALYSISDVALVTPLRDGMNLIAKEYVSAKSNKRGVLILSEMAGASKELGEALLINPNNIEEIATTIKEALEIPEAEQIRRMESMQSRLQRYTIIRWATDFINELHAVVKERDRLSAKMLTAELKKQMMEDFSAARRKILFLDYDGTLVPFTGDPQAAEPDDELRSMAARLVAKPETDVIIISGRPRDILDEWFGSLGAVLVAEHGVWIKRSGRDWELTIPLSNDWKQQALPLFFLYTDIVPGSFVEEKEFSIAWHYRKADPELASTRARELLDEIDEFTAHVNVHAVHGNKVVELRCAGADKGTAAKHLLAGRFYDFILAVGDDRTDEDLFKVMPEDVYSIKVGFCPSRARYSVSNYKEIRLILEELASV